MADVQSLLSDYIAEHRAGGEADPLAFLARVEGADRAELGALIDGYLARTPRQIFDAAAFASSAAAPVVEALSRSIEGAGGLWPQLLPLLRARAKLKRSELVDRLAAALGAEGRETKVARYYHQMESGDLPATGVNARVLEALGAIVGESAEALRTAGRALGGGAAGAGGQAVFARTAWGDESVPEIMSVEMSMPPGGQAEEHDEIDALFLDG